MDMALSNWLKLVRAWRKGGRSGLTLEFLCAACGMQPKDLLYDVYMQQMPVEYCHRIMSPLLGWARQIGGQRGFTIVQDARDHLLDWLDIAGDFDSDDMYNLLIDYVHAQLAEGIPSRYRVRSPHGWMHNYNTNGPFQKADKTFIKKVLGHNPPEITGVSRTGRIQYRKCCS